MTTTTDVRDRIGAFLVERGGFGQMGESVLTEGGVTWCCNRVTPAVFVALAPPSVGIVGVHVDGTPVHEMALIHADAPDLLARLGETLDGLGC